MKLASRHVIVGLVSVLLLAGCGGGGGGGGAGGTQAVTFALGAGNSELLPAGSDTLSTSVDLARLGLQQLDRVYELETPANMDFAFTIVARTAGNAGAARFSLAHAAAGGANPVGGSESLAAAGLVLDGAGVGNRGTWLDVAGDGFARLTIRGRITQDQVIVTESDEAAGSFHAGIRIRIGQASLINVAAESLPTLPGLTTTTIFSSDSFQFGLPAIAVSGDRYSVTAYDGSSAAPFATGRSRVWLQYDATAASVTGGRATSAAADSGTWRDQELAAKDNVLCIAYTGDGQVRADISLDRGATFPIQQILDAGNQMWGQRLIQVAIADDYTIAFLFWRSVGTISSPRSELTLIEATPTGFDSNATPTGYAFAPDQAIHDLGVDVSPLLMSLVYSDAGDLVIGYGYTSVVPQGDPGLSIYRASYRCDVRLAGQALQHHEIESVERVIPSDPHVTVIGNGSTMNIFYTYDKDDGIHVYRSQNAGHSFSKIGTAGSPGAMMPSIHARVVGEALKLDVLFLNPAAGGLELHDLKWNDVYTGPSAVYRVTEATLTPTPTPPGGTPPPGTGAPFGGMPGGFTTTSVGWFGYDAVTDGDRIAAVVFEQTAQSYSYFWMLGGGIVTGSGSGSGAGQVPMLLPGMTGPVPAPNPADRNQLKLLVIQ